MDDKQARLVLAYLRGYARGNETLTAVLDRAEALAVAMTADDADAKATA